jgi:hypothetical protein
LTDSHEKDGKHGRETVLDEGIAFVYGRFAEGIAESLTAKSKKSKKFCAVIDGWTACVLTGLAVGEGGGI